MSVRVCVCDSVKEHFIHFIDDSGREEYGKYSNYILFGFISLPFLWFI